MLTRSGALFLLCWIILNSFPGLISSATVTLSSIEIYNEHEWLSVKPTVYFRCKKEHKTFLPDVTQAHVLYIFKGEESWQPLTKLTKQKCKRCGFYEKDHVKSDDVFDEWEFCPSDFTGPNGIYIHFKEREFNATFLCPECITLGSDSNQPSQWKGLHLALVIMISVAVSAVLIFGLWFAYKYWQRRKREQDQARFLKLFEDDDDIEDELGIGPIGGVLYN